MKKRETSHVPWLLVVTMLAASLAMPALLTTSASADSGTRKDGNDTTGALDLSSVSVAHNHGIVYTFKTFKAFVAKTLAPNSYLLVAMDLDLDGDADRCAFIFESGSRFTGALTNCGNKYFYALAVRHPTSTTATITMSETLFKRTYRWRAFSFYQQAPNCGGNGCVDAVPNRGLVVHDMTLPTVAWTTPQPALALSTDLSLTTSLPLDFTASDDRRVASWSIQHLLSWYANTWDVLASGADGGHVHTDLVVEEGRSYQLKAFATDRAGNIGSSPTFLNITVPFDDANAIMGYTANWASEPVPGAFQHAHMVSSTLGAAVTFTVDIPISGAEVWVIGGAGNGTANFCAGTTCNVLTETPSTPELSYVGSQFHYGVGGNPTTLTVTVTSGTFNIDGIVVMPP